MNKPKRHHYLPRFYLEGFTDPNGLLWVYDFDEEEFRQQTPINTAVKTHYYSFRGVNGKKHTDIEVILADKIEGKIKPIITKLDNGEELNPAERESLAIFCSYMITRVPKFEEWVNYYSTELFRLFSISLFSFKEKAEEILKSIEEETGEKLDADPEKLLELIESGEYDINFPREHSLGTMLVSGVKMAPLLLQMNWSFLTAPSGCPFITTDCPFFLIAPEGYDRDLSGGLGLITPGARKIIPLSAKTCLVIGDQGSLVTRHKASVEMMLVISAEAAARSLRFMIANDKTRLEEVLGYVE